MQRLFTSDECARVPGLIGTQPADHGWTNYLWHGNPQAPRKLVGEWRHQFSGYPDARGSFASLWQMINAFRGYGWDANPWVFALTFRRLA